MTAEEIEQAERIARLRYLQADTARLLMEVTGKLLVPSEALQLAGFSAVELRRAESNSKRLKEKALGEA